VSQRNIFELINNYFQKYIQKQIVIKCNGRHKNQCIFEHNLNDYNEYHVYLNT